jgi:hypothetical protein
VVVGNEKGRYALREVIAEDRLDVVGCTIARFPALDVDNGAKAALKRTATA